MKATLYGREQVPVFSDFYEAKDAGLLSRSEWRRLGRKVHKETILHVQAGVSHADDTSRQIRENPSRKFAAAILLYEGHFQEEKNMNVTADQRRSVLKLFNISEAARQLGWPVKDMFSRIRMGQLPKPQIPLGRRFYFSADDLQRLRQQGPEKSHQ